MEYVLHRRSVGQSLVRLVLVVGVHIVVISAIVTTLNQARIAIRKTPPAIEYILPVLEPKKPEPIKEIKAHKATMATPLVTPPEILIVNPPIAVETVTVPPSGDAKTSDPGPVIAASGSDAKPVSGSVGVACPNSADVRSALRYPKQALRDGIEGEVLVRFIVGTDGALRDVHLVSSSHRVFNNAVLSAVQQFNCVGQNRDVAVEVPFSFKLN